MGNCHCSECRKFSGTDYASVGGLDSSKFKIIDGESDITYFHKTEETDLAFCSVCGSSLFSRKNTGHRHNVRLGILNDIPASKPTFHILRVLKLSGIIFAMICHSSKKDLQTIEQRV